MSGSLGAALSAAALAGCLAGDATAQPARAAAPLQFVVEVAPGLLDAAQDGRVFVVLAGDDKAEPRRSIGRMGLRAPLVAARDARLGPGGRAVIDSTAITFPLDSLEQLPAGDYFVQALFDWNIEARSVNAPGNLYSAVEKRRIDPRAAGPVVVRLSERVPPEPLPAETEHVKFVELRSERLSAFHGRPALLRAGVILPRDYDREPKRRYPLRIHIGGYGARFTGVQKLMQPDAEFARTWLADGTPRMIFVHLDGDGPYGDPYQVNSANNGPYGDAVTEELIPHLERTFRAVGAPAARFLDGGSTGGWVALALQVFYPDFFNGAWAGYPDPVDFRAYQLVNIYEDENAYLSRTGFERPSAREPNGDVRFTMRHECQMENVMGPGDSYVRSGNVWGAWNAVYGPRGKDGRPAALWDPRTGKIDRAVAQEWKKYDLRLILETRWPALASRLRGKLHIWVGDADDYFLNNAVQLLDAFLSSADPPYGGSILYGRGKGHDWPGLSDLDVMRQMMQRYGESAAP